MWPRHDGNDCRRPPLVALAKLVMENLNLPSDDEGMDTGMILPEPVGDDDLETEPCVPAVTKKRPSAAPKQLKRNGVSSAAKGKPQDGRRKTMKTQKDDDDDDDALSGLPNKMTDAGKDLKQKIASYVGQLLAMNHASYTVLTQSSLFIFAHPFKHRDRLSEQGVFVSVTGVVV